MRPDLRTVPATTWDTDLLVVCLTRTYTSFRLELDTLITLWTLPRLQTDLVVTGQPCVHGHGMISELMGLSDSDVYLIEYEYAKTPVLWKRVTNLVQLLRKCVHIRSSILRCRCTSLITHADAANTSDSICRRVEHELNKLMGLVVSLHFPKHIKLYVVGWIHVTDH